MSTFSKIFLTGLFLIAAPLCSAHAPVGKAFKNENVKLLDIKLRNTLVVIYRIHKSSHEINKSIGLLKTAHQNKTHTGQEAEFVKIQLSQSLQLVAPFINDIRAFKDLIIPLVQESNKNHDIKNSSLTNFLNSGDTLDVFTGKNITSIESLQALLEEIHVFFLDLFASLSKETKDAYKKYIDAEKAKSAPQPK